MSAQMLLAPIEFYADIYADIKMYEAQADHIGPGATACTLCRSGTYYLSTGGLNDRLI